MLLYFIEKDKVEIYRFTKGKIKKLSEKGVQKWYYLFEKKIGILSRDLLIHIKKKYPKVNPKELKKLIANEADELSPYPNFEYFYKIGGSGPTFIEVDFWFLDKEHLETLKSKGFSFTHLLPEDLLFTHKETLFVISKRDKIFLLAFGERFVNSVIFPLPLEKSNLRLFLNSLSGNEIKEIWIYGKKEEIPSNLFEEIFEKNPPKFVYKKEIGEDLPHFLEKISLKAFKVKKVFPVRELLIGSLRISAWVTLAFIFYLYLTFFSYDREVQNLRKEIQKIEENEKKLSSMEKVSLGKKEKEEFTKERIELRDELKKIEGERTKDIMVVLDALAGILPDGAFIKSFEMKEKKLTLLIHTNDVIETLKEIKRLELFQEIKVIAAPIYDPVKKIYAFRVETTLK